MSTSPAQKYFYEAQTFRERGHLEKAIASYIKAVGIDPCFISAHYTLALLYHQTQQFDNAVIHLKKAIELDPNDASAFNNLGVICFAKNMFNEAKTYFEKALSLEANYKEALDNLKKIQDKLQQKIQVQPFIEQSINTNHKNKKSLKVGFVSIWFERGQSYVTKTLRDVIAEEHETFVFARTGGVYGRSMLQTDGIWAVPNLTIFSDYHIPHKVIGNWIDESAIDAVIFNEEYDWSLVDFCKKKGIKVITYLDYYKDDWKPCMYLYDAVLCSTKRTFNLVKDFCNAYYIGWGINTELFKPLNNDRKKYTFFHNAGWLGINYRKMTPAVILAFDAIYRQNPGVTLLIHAQAELEKLPPQIVNIVHNNAGITYHVETVPAPGLYHKGSILVFPSKLEGLGLPLLEGLACGLPAIATDAPPMNEFVRDGYNGLLVKVAQRFTRQDNIAFPEEIVDISDLTLKMDYLMKNPELVHKMQENARNSVNNYTTFGKKVNEVINSINKTSWI